MKNTLYYYFDAEADVLYFSQGKPSAKSITEETNDDVLLRRDPKSRKVTGFTILNFSHRLKGAKSVPLSLPVNLEFSSVV